MDDGVKVLTREMKRDIGKVVSIVLTAFLEGVEILNSKAQSSGFGNRVNVSTTDQAKKHWRKNRI